MSSIHNSKAPSRSSSNPAKAPPQSKKILIQQAPSLGSPGSSLATAGGTATINHPVQRPLPRAGSASPRPSRESSSQRMRHFRESRSPLRERRGPIAKQWEVRGLAQQLASRTSPLTLPASRVPPERLSVQPGTYLTLWTGYMPDSFLGLFRFGLTAGRSPRRQAAKVLGSVINGAKLDVGEVDTPIAALGLSDADGLAAESLADEDVLATPLDLAIVADAADGEFGSVGRLIDPIGIAARRGVVVARGGLLTQGFVGPIVVEVAAEAIEARLLLVKRGGRRTSGLGFERAMHALVPSVLLRRSRLDALEADAELDPMNRQRRQAADGRRGEGRAIIAANGARQAELAHGPLDDRQDAIAGRRHDAAVDEQATIRVGERQGIAASPIAGAEPALEVDAPQIVGRNHRRKGLACRRRRAPPPPRR